HDPPHRVAVDGRRLDARNLVRVQVVELADVSVYASVQADSSARVEKLGGQHPRERVEVDVRVRKDQRMDRDRGRHRLSRSILGGAVWSAVVLHWRHKLLLGPYGDQTRQWPSMPFSRLAFRPAWTKRGAQPPAVAGWSSWRVRPAGVPRPRKTFAASTTPNGSVASR